MESAKEQARLEYIPLSSLRAAQRNPKLHDQQAIHDSYQRFGFVSPILIDEKTQRIVAGHGRLEALLAMKSRGEQAPARIVVKDQDWLVPVIRGLTFESEKEAEADLLAGNQLTIALGFDEKLLAEILPDHQMNVTGLGFSQEELQKYIPQFRTIELEPETPPIQEQAVSRTGDLWQLDKHRVLCGDSTKLLEQVSADSVDQVLTDPPYGADLLIGRQQLGHRTVANDEGLTWLPAIANHCWRILKSQSVCVLFGQWRTYCDFATQFQQLGFRLRTVGVWDKKNAGLGDGLAEAYKQIQD